MWPQRWRSNLQKSRVPVAPTLNMAPDVAMRAIRFSLDRYIGEDEADALIGQLHRACVVAAGSTVGLDWPVRRLPVITVSQFQAPPPTLGSVLRAAPPRPAQ